MTRFSSGAYCPGDSILHALNSAVKLICFFLLLIAVFTTETAPGFFAMLVFAAATAYISQLGKKEVLMPVRACSFFLLAVLLINFFFAAPEAAFWSYSFVTPSVNGLLKGMGRALRISLALVFLNILSRTTPPFRLAKAVESLLSPLSKLGRPISVLSAVIGLSLCFIPALYEDAKRIRMFQLGRGARFESRNFFERAAAVLPLVVPLFVSAFNRAETLSMSMVSRGCVEAPFGLSSKKPELASRDWAALLVCTAVCIFQIFVD